jgi:peptidoglycan/xylan/chitin deacetylase (PgdA/CDA1 family)
MTIVAADVPVLMYHEITASPFGSARLAVPPASFAAQITYLRDTGFTGITAGQVASALARGERLPDRSVVLTFDDGFADFHEVALPILQRHGFTATLYMTTGWIRGAKDAAGSAPGPMLSWSQLSEVASAGIEIGAHSHRHRELDQLDDRALYGELATSKEILEDGLATAVPGLAYPFGYSSARVRGLAHQVGYGHAYAVGNRRIGPEPDLYALPRLTVSRATRLRVYGQVAECRNLPAIFLKDRALTKGWAAVRRARRVKGLISD